MKSFTTFLAHLTECGYNGVQVNDHVQVNHPGHEDHGKIGRAIRQQTVDFGVEFPHDRDKLHWHNAGKLQKVSPKY